jgi:hypothetical protein
MKPLELSLVATNVMLLVVIAMVYSIQITVRSTNIERFVAAHHETMNLLATCYVPLRLQ